MTRCTLITLGALKEDYLARAVEEYKKRLSAYATVEEINLRDEKLLTEKESEVASALEAEADRILAKIPEGATVVALCVEGKEYTSEGLAEVIGNARDRSGKLCFIIGGSCGMSERIKSSADLKLSMSRMTFPHHLARVMLIEQLYRGFKINEGSRYHK